MKQATIALLCCPFDKHNLELNTIKQENDTIHEGYLVCSACQRIYPVIKGIPIMNPDAYREFSLEQPLLKKWGISANKHFQLETKHTLPSDAR